MSATTTGAPGALASMLDDLALTASKDKALPFLTAIRLHTADGTLHGWSTDRFRAAHATVPVEGSLPHPVLISRADAAAAAKAFRKATCVDLTAAAGDKVTLTGDGVSMTFGAPCELDSLPNLARTVREELPEDHAGVVFQAEYLADFATIGKRRKAYVEFVPENDRRPTHVRIGDDYRAWLMPLRQPDSGKTVAWMPHSWEVA